MFFRELVFSNLFIVQIGNFRVHQPNKKIIYILSQTSNFSQKEYLNKIQVYLYLFIGIDKKMVNFQGLV